MGESDIPLTCRASRDESQGKEGATRLIKTRAASERAHSRRWGNLSTLKEGDRVALYLKSGRRIEDDFRIYYDHQIVVSSGPVARDAVAVVTNVPADRAGDGALIGAAAGFAVIAAATAGVLTGLVLGDRNPLEITLVVKPSGSGDSRTP